jgi:thiol-disulfide isomerase/thioredoxin
VGRAKYLVIALGLIIFSGVAFVIARDTPPEVIDDRSAEQVLDEEPGPPAPPLDGAGEGWINSDPLTDADVEGQVVVYDFWTYSCVNCIRTLPYLRAWYERYEDDGLVIIGVHSPEFEFEEDPENVQMAVDEDGVTWPVLLDPQMEVWDSFANQYWPAKYVFDRDGQLRYFHPGEGAYDVTEDVLRELLGVDPDSPRAEVDDGTDDTEDAMLQTCTQLQVAGLEGGCQTPETYLGQERGGIASSSPETLEVGVGTYTALDPQPLHSSALTGPWDVGEESVTSVVGSGSILMAYEADEVNLVMAPPDGGSVEVVVELDGEPVPEAARGADVTERDDGATVVTVDSDDLYALIRTDAPQQGTLTLEPQGPGLSAFAFTFGS